MIAYQIYNDAEGIGRALILLWGLLTLEWVFINTNGYHLSFGVKIFHVGCSLTVHT
ncbi:MAG: hypothetical protein H8E70_00425 [Candidatus Marinimicrobia bacterium]|nr:hypothetical protein [Candidatus Neomarinimicrobiota bacterium]